MLPCTWGSRRIQPVKDVPSFKLNLCHIYYFPKDQLYNRKYEKVQQPMKNGVFWVVTPCGSCKNRRSSAFISVTKIGELGTTQAATSNRRTLRRNNFFADTILHSHRRENLKSSTAHDSVRKTWQHYCMSLLCTIPCDVDGTYKSVTACPSLWWP
jgi:hypothetical protein